MMASLRATSRAFATLALAVTPAASWGQTSPHADTASLPPSEAGLPIIRADRPIAVSDATKDLESPVFLPNGDLVFCDVQGHRILRLDRSGKITAVATFSDLMPGGLAIGPDGRLYVAAASNAGGGAIISVTIDGDDRRTILAQDAGYTPNDIVVDAQGGFYFTDSRGSIGDPAGGVFRIAPGGQPVPVVRHLAVANGIALAPDGKTLWVGEFAAGSLYRIGLKDAVTQAPFAATTAYRFTGSPPDSMRTDPAGRAYVALYGGGRVLIFSASGVPVGQILLPGREAGRNLHSTSLAIAPNGHDVVIVTSSGTPGSGTVYRAHLP